MSNVRGWSVFAGVSALLVGLACGGAATPEELAAEAAEKEAALAKLGPAKATEQALASICQGDSVDLVFGLAGHKEAVGPLALDEVMFTRWIDAGLGDANNGKVVELGPTDLDWYYALDVYCAGSAVCEGTACTIDAPGQVLRIEHRVIGGEAKIVAAFKGDSLDGDAAGLKAAQAAWQRSVDTKYPATGGAPAPAPIGGGDVAEVPAPRPAAGGGGRQREAGGGGGGGKAGKRTQ